MSDSISAGRVGHAYIFSGPDGIGRKSMALCFAEALTCQQGGTVPCGACEACILNKNHTNPDIVFIRQQEGKATVGVEDVRSVQEEISTAPQYGKYKVILFEHAEKMTVQAQNALLKTLEEPPAYIVMILMTSNVSLLLDTVRSRAVRVDFKRNTDSEIVEIFTRVHPEIMMDKSILCEYADGIIGRALMMADPAAVNTLCDKILQAVCSLNENGGRGLCAFENLFAENADKKDLFFFTLYSLFRDAAVYGRYQNAAPLQNSQITDKIQRLSGTFGYHGAMECVAHIDRAWKLIGQNVNYKLACDSLAIRIREVIHGTSSRSSF